MYDNLDELLKTELLTPPDGFEARVMQRIAALPSPWAAAKPPKAPDLVEWLAVAGAVAAGMSQLVAFVFGIWAVTSAG